MKYLYRLYELCVAIPLFLVLTIVLGSATYIGCIIGNGNFWGYWPGHLWAWLTVRLLLLPVKVEGRENLEKGQSYVFVANHQGVFDIFLVYGFLNRNFKWMMKRGLISIPVVGPACKASHQIIVDKRGWASSAAVRSCWRMSSTCQSVRLPSTGPSTSCHA